MATFKATVGNIVEMIHQEAMEWIYFLFHYTLMRTPMDLNWQYLFNDEGEVSIAYLVDANDVEVGRYDVEKEMVLISGKFSSAKYFISRELPASMWMVQRKMLSYLKHESGNPYLGPRILLAKYEVANDELVECKHLDKKNYCWHVRNEQMWLQDSRSKRICEINLDKNVFKYLKADWKEITFKDLSRFTEYIEKSFRSGHKRA